MTTKRRLVRLLCLFLTVFVLASCAKKKDKKEKETTATPPETTVEETTEAEEEPEPLPPEFTNPLTGLECDKDLSKKRPVSIMINNIWDSLPQEGVGQADILYECLAEGGITRLMMLVTDYESLPKTGSVRSARHYYIDFAEGYNAIFVHAGGSPFAYSTFAERGNDRIDGVNGPADLYYTTNTFFRDPERLPYYSAEHTLMVQNGAGLKAAIEYYGFSTEKTEGYEEPMKFVPYGEATALPDKALHARVEMSSYQTVDFSYDEKTGKYLRYQYDGEKHVDKSTGEQLAFENVVLLFSETGAIPGDDKARINIQTTGTGDAVYLTGGTYERIKWQKDSHSAVLKFFRADGSELLFNRGKTMINVVPTYEMDYVILDNNTIK